MMIRFNAANVDGFHDSPMIDRYCPVVKNLGDGKRIFGDCGWCFRLRVTLASIGISDERVLLFIFARLDWQG